MDQLFSGHKCGPTHDHDCWRSSGRAVTHPPGMLGKSCRVHTVLIVVFAVVVAVVFIAVIAVLLGPYRGMSPGRQPPHPSHTGDADRHAHRQQPPQQAASRQLVAGAGSSPAGPARRP